MSHLCELTVEKFLRILVKSRSTIIGQDLSSIGRHTYYHCNRYIWQSCQKLLCRVRNRTVGSNISGLERRIAVRYRDKVTPIGRPLKQACFWDHKDSHYFVSGWTRLSRIYMRMTRFVILAKPSNIFRATQIDRNRERHMLVQVGL